ncbi:hypothetical protein V1506DRAFT_510219 [Lipomyces tetrasporus]
MNALITRGDSGIGRSIATLFAREGANVGMLLPEEKEDAENSKEIIERDPGREIQLYSGDVKDPAFAKSIVDSFVTKYGCIFGILVYNAGYQNLVDASKNWKSNSGT